METKTKNSYETPAATAVEVKMDTGILITSTMWVIMGTESGVTPSSNGIEDYTLDSGSKNW